MARKFVFFDFDGVIVDTFNICFEITRMKNAAIDEEGFRGIFEGNIHEAIEKGHLKQENNFVDFPAEYASRIASCAPIDPIPQIIEELASSFELAVLSANSQKLIGEFAHKHGFAKFFSRIIGHETHKRKTMMIRMMLETYSINPQDAILITDTLGDVREANQAGIRSLAVLWGFHSRETLQKGKPHSFIERPGDIAQAIHEYFPVGS